MDYNFLKKLDHQYGTPFYLMHAEKFRQNIKGLREAFAQWYDKLIVGYSFKTNYVPAISGLADQNYCYAEVVSEMEYDMALALNFPPGKIIFNGPIKTSNALRKALDLESVVNLDSEYEVDEVVHYAQTHPNRPIYVGLRVNIELNDAGGNSKIQSGLRSGRFGFSKELLPRVIRRLRANGVAINAIHGHTSSTDRAVQNYLAIAKYMLEVCKTYRLEELAYFNIGGGFFGAAADGIDITDKPTYADYAEAITGMLLKDDWFLKHRPALVLEPGVSVVANVFSLVTKVFQNKTFGEKNFVVVDTSVFEVKPSMHQINLPFDLYSKSSGAESWQADVVGSTCMEKDVILNDVKLPRPQRGDYICIRGVGAYTLVFTPDFINYVPPIVKVDGNQTALVRRKQNLEDILKPYTLS